MVINTVTPKYDFIQYYSAANLIQSSENPYDENLLYKEELKYRNYDEVIKMWNPPTVLPFIYFLPQLNYESALFLWSVLGFLTYYFAIYIFSKEIKLDIEKKMYMLGGLILFPPLLAMQLMAQISFIPLFGLVLFFYFYTKERKFLSGLFLGLTLIKPHLLYLLYLYIFFESFKIRNFYTIFGMIVTSIFFSLFVTLINSDLWFWYFEAMKNNPVGYWKTTTVGSFLSVNLKSSFLWYFPTIFTSVIFTFFYFLRMKNIQFNKISKIQKYSIISALTGVSLVTSPYGWLFDHILLIPCFLIILENIFNSINISHKRKKIYMLYLFLINFIACIALFMTSHDKMLWYSLLIAIICLMISVLNFKLDSLIPNKASDAL